MASTATRYRAAAPAGLELRAEPRHSVGVKRASVRRHGAPAADATLEDISIYGCKLGSVDDHAPGDRLWLRFAGKPAVAATLIWCEAGQIGCRFDAPLDRELVRALTLRLV